MVTALSELDHKIRAMEAGADDFLIKPVNSIEIIARVRSLLKVKYFHDQLVKTKEKIEAQNDFKTVMANILPILLQNIPADKKTELIMEMGKQVEEVIWEKYIHEQPGNSKEAAQVSCNIMNRLGGLVAEAEDETRRTKMNLETMRAKMAESFRSVKTREGKKPTVQEVDDHLLLHPVCKKKQERYFEAMKTEKYINSIYWSFKEKQENLKKLSLTLQQGDLNSETIQAAMRNMRSVEFIGVE